MRINFLRAVVSMAVLLLTACSEAPKTDSTSGGDSVPSTPVTGKTAFWPMYKSAYAWASDMMPLRVESKDAPGSKSEPGKAGTWKATFGSTRRREAIDITYSVAAHPPEIARGINVGHPFPWAGPTLDALAFQTSDFSVDSDAAYKTALGQAQAWLKKHPDKEVSFTLGHASRFSAPVWYVLWGDNKIGYSVYINAKTGEITKPAK
jgi:hypothetical protein